MPLLILLIGIKENWNERESDKQQSFEATRLTKFIDGRRNGDVASHRDSIIESKAIFISAVHTSLN